MSLNKIQTIHSNNSRINNTPLNNNKDSPLKLLSNINSPSTMRISNRIYQMFMICHPTTLIYMGGTSNLSNNLLTIRIISNSSNMIKKESISSLNHNQINSSVSIGMEMTSRTLPQETFMQREERTNRQPITRGLMIQY
jgi:hypothetical protein